MSEGLQHLFKHHVVVLFSYMYCSQYEFRRVSCRGKYIKGLSMPIGPRTNDGNNGFYLVVPFQLKDGYVYLRMM
jgi:cytochrome oxidase assembly protein ShyY1